MLSCPEDEDVTGRDCPAYRHLLVLLPRTVRDRFGRDMEEAFAHRLSGARTPMGRGWVWVRGTADVLASAAIERLRSVGWRRRLRGRMGTEMQDLRRAARSVVRSPLFASTAVLTLALGIGASTATFSVAGTVLFKPLPYRDPNRLVAVWPEKNFNTAMVRDALAHVPALQSASGLSGWGLTLVGEGEPLQVNAMRVSTDHFRVLGVVPELGRPFVSEEGLPGRNDVVVLSHSFWIRVFGGDPSVIGRRIRLSGDDADQHTIIGVLPAGYRPVSGRPELWVPLPLDPTATISSDDSWYVNEHIARLAPGFTLEQASEQVRRWAAGLRASMPRQVSEDDVRTARVQPLSEYVARDMQPALWAALAAVSLVLLIACVNVANLLLARGEARARDLAVRRALGASRRSLAGMLLSESTLLGFLGGTLGIVASFGLLRLVGALAPTDFPRIREVGLDGPVLLYAVVVTLLATLAAGVVPAVRVSRVDATATLGGAARGASARRGSRLSLGLVGAEIALAVVVTIGSGLMLRSLMRMTSVDIGLDTRRLLVMQPSPPSGRYASNEDVQVYFSRVTERVAALPGVGSVGAIQLLPGTFNNWNFPTWPEGVDVPEGTPAPSVNFRVVRAGYFETVALPPLRGRLLNDRDRTDTQKVMVVNQEFVDSFWPGLNPIGRTIRTLGRGSDPFTVVGVVGNVRQHGYAQSPEPEMYVTQAQWAWTVNPWLVIRVDGEGPPLREAAAVQKAIWSVDPDVPISGVDALSHVFDESAASTRFLAVVLGSFGALALLLGALGVFGVTSYVVGQRTGEFGVRMALGSSRRGVLATALATCGPAVLVGLALGLGGAVVSARVLRSVLYGIEPSDPGTFAMVGTTLLVVAVLASLVPAWRASRIDPVRVLKAE